MPEGIATNNFYNTTTNSRNQVDVNELRARATGNKKQANSTSNNSNLGKDDFLKLLVTQLRHQDPSDPVKDQKFIAQMAQFSSLEQMQNISQGVAKLANRQAYTLVGQYVVGKDFTSGQKLEGTVQAVFFDSNKESFLRVNGRVMKISDLESIEQKKDKKQENALETAKFQESSLLQKQNNSNQKKILSPAQEK